ncbi:HAD-IB family phosphatase [uncultured Ilyobacter sp.]|uniref:HAD-IB family phosphatase n=1 Tax=uncultured Ilyobacter sp. TaxID=544433 RepID=UPI0029F57137|nr:HAD-IB family phosphatase [uncultured Ilyobacter sp.]
MKKRIFLVDFDRTISDRDTTAAILERHNPELLLSTRKIFRNGEIDIKRYLQILIESLSMTEKEFEKEISIGIEIDSFFKDFFQKNHEIRIVSAGTYHNVMSNLKKAGIEFPKEHIYSNILKFHGKKIKVEFHDADSFEGICKKKVVEKYIEKYKEVVFIGDGSSDYYGASKAHRVFAKRGLRLEEYCLANNIEYTPYESFEDIIKIYSI